MSAESAIREKIVEVIADYLATELKISTTEISGTDVLKELPGADSMKLLRVVSKLERQWEVEFDDEAIFSVKTVEELVALVEKHVSGDLAAP